MIIHCLPTKTLSFFNTFNSTLTRGCRRTDTEEGSVVSLVENRQTEDLATFRQRRGRNHLFASHADENKRNNFPLTDTFIDITPISPAPRPIYNVYNK